MKNIFITLLLVLALFQGTRATIHSATVYDNIYNSGDLYYDIDLNGDNDFHLNYINGSGYNVQGMSATCYFAADSPVNKPKSYTYGAGLGTYHWISYPAPMDYFTSGTKYIMVKFNNGPDTYYGWIEILDYLDQLYVTGYAYNDVPNQTITAGQTNPTAINETPAPCFDLSKIGQHQISFKNCDAYDKVKIYGYDGKLLSEINNPAALQCYPLEASNNAVIITYYKKEQLLTAVKQIVLN